MPARGANAASRPSFRTPRDQAELVWFQGVKWIEKRIEVGREYLVFGRPSFYRGELSMAHPELETMEQALSRKAESGMQGIYPSTEKLGNVLGAKGMYQIICNAWTLAKDRIADPLPESRAHPVRADRTARRHL